MLLQSGYKLSKYTIKEQLGEAGGFGVVFRAIEDITGRVVAIKQFFVGGEQAEDEMKVLARLAHSNIIQYVTYENLNDTTCLVMEYAPKGNLADEIIRRGQMTEAEALNVVCQIAEALAFANSRDVVHRDIKPQNILCFADSTYKLGDFGISRLLEKTHSRTQGRGSIYYVAPEIFKGEFNKKSDIYSLGVTFHEMLSGSPPYTGTDHEVMFKHLDENSRPELPEGISPLARRILEGCMEKDVDKRWDVGQLITTIKPSKSNENAQNRPNVVKNKPSAAAQATCGRVDSGDPQPIGRRDVITSLTEDSVLANWERSLEILNVMLTQDGWHISDEKTFHGVYFENIYACHPGFTARFFGIKGFKLLIKVIPKLDLKTVTEWHSNFELFNNRSKENYIICFITEDVSADALKKLWSSKFRNYKGNFVVIDAKNKLVHLKKNNQLVNIVKVTINNWLYRANQKGEYVNTNNSQKKGIVDEFFSGRVRICIFGSLFLLFFIPVWFIFVLHIFDFF